MFIIFLLVNKLFFNVSFVLTMVVEMETLNMMTLYLDNGVVALFQVRAVPVSGDPNGVASIFGRMMQRGVSIALGPVWAMDRAIRIHGFARDIWAATKILFQTLRHPALRHPDATVEVDLNDRYIWVDHELVTPNRTNTRGLVNYYPRDFTFEEASRLLKD